MKKLLFVSMMCLLALSIQAQRIAVLDFNAGSGISQADVDGISAIFNTYFSPQGYTLVERTRIDRIIDEQGFQRGRFTQDQMVRIGELLNVSRVVVGDINYAFKQYNVDVRVVNVESGTIAAKSGVTWNTGESYREMMKSLAMDLEKQVAILPQPVAVEVPAENVDYIERVSYNEYKYGDKWMTRKEYYTFINDRDRCVPAYQQFQKGLKLEKAGKWTAVAGSGVLLVGTLTLAIGMPVNSNYSSYSSPTYHCYYTCMITGSILMPIGFVTTITGFSLWGAGVKKKNNAYKPFNEHCAQKQTASAVTLNLQSNQNGIGLALNF